jgi:hypothetical protein
MVGDFEVSILIRLGDGDRAGRGLRTFDHDHSTGSGAGENGCGLIAGLGERTLGLGLRCEHLPNALASPLRVPPHVAQKAQMGKFETGGMQALRNAIYTACAGR